MSPVLVDTSVWIQYFRGAKSFKTAALENLIDNNQLCINDLILAEMVPYLRVRRETALIGLLEVILRIPLSIDWRQVIEIQTANLNKGINNIGVSDIVLAQNASDHGVRLYTLDKHFRLMVAHLPLQLFEEDA